MNFVYGQIVDLSPEQGMNFGTVRVGGVLKKTPLDLLTNPRPGDKVLLCDGVAISKVTQMTKPAVTRVKERPGFP